MGSLQLWLAVVGALVLAGVIAHGAWQTRKAQGELRRATETDDDAPAGTAEQAAAAAAILPDPLADGPREPSFDEPALAAADGLAPGPALAEADGTAATATDPVASPLPLARQRVAPARVDALIDAVVTLTVEAPVSGEMALAHQPTSRRAGGKPFLIEGLDRDRGEWEAPRPGHFYGEFQAGLQLANRLGAINEIEFSEFVQKIQAFAEAIGALADFPDMLETVGRARELDAFASEHDAQLALRLRAKRAAWALPFVMQHAARHGFVAGATPGRLVLPSPEEGAPPMLSLQFDPQAALADDPKQARLTEVTLAFDVPQTPPGDEPFNAWCAAGHALSIGLDAMVSDDNGNTLAPEAFPGIGQELQGLYAELSQRDLAAGSPAARRLFS